MPTYDYICGECQHEFEAFQSITADPLDKCPECGGKVRRRIGAGGGLIFRGSGFYVTDYRSKEYQDRAKAEKTESKSASSETKSESSGSETKAADSS